jgi:hypothetical protein
MKLTFKGYCLVAGRMDAVAFACCATGWITDHCCLYIYIYRVSQEEGTKLRESVPYVKIYLYNPKHLCPKFERLRR